MSSRFVSAGKIDAATGDAVKEKAAAAKESATKESTQSTEAPPSAPLASTTPSTTTTTATSAPSPPISARQAEWAAVEKQLEAERQKRAEARKALGSGVAEKSLFDVLQANKAAKQAAFEEAHRLKNQFRALDEDEIEFLEGVEADARREAARVAAETAAGLDAFRAAQSGKKEDDKGSDDDGDNIAVEETDTTWSVNRKRKRKDKADAFPNLKRKGSAADKEKKEEGKKEEPGSKKPEAAPATSTEGKTAPPAPKAKPALGLVAYGSDDDDSD